MNRVRWYEGGAILCVSARRSLGRVRELILAREPLPRWVVIRLPSGGQEGQWFAWRSGELLELSGAGTARDRPVEDVLGMCEADRAPAVRRKRDAERFIASRCDPAVDAPPWEGRFVLVRAGGEVQAVGEPGEPRAEESFDFQPVLPEDEGVDEEAAAKDGAAEEELSGGAVEEGATDGEPDAAPEADGGPSLGGVRGTVKWFNDQKGYGFISQEGGPDVFVHSRDIEHVGFRALPEGQMVEFRVTEGPKGPQAVNVRVAEPEPEEGMEDEEEVGAGLGRIDLGGLRRGRIAQGPVRVYTTTGRDPLDAGALEDARVEGESGFEEEGKPHRVSLTFSADGPEEVAVGKVALVDFRIERVEGAKPLAGASASADARPDDAIRVFVSTHGAPVEPLGPRYFEVPPPGPGHAAQDVFELRVLEAGEVRVAVHFRQGGSELAQLILAFLAVEDAPSAGRVATASPAAPRHRDDDDVVDLFIQEERDGTRVRYQYLLTAESLGFKYREFFSPELRDRGGGVAASTISYVESVYERVLDPDLTSWRDAKRLQRKISAVGASMSDELFDPAFVRLLWEHRDRVRTVHVISWEPFIPWELLRLRHPDTDELDEKYLCEYGLVRQIRGQEIPRELRLEDWSYLQASYPSGTERPVGRETAYFTETLPARGVHPRAIEPEYDAVFDALNEGAFDVLHVACHGESPHGSISDAVLILGEEPGNGGPAKPLEIDPVTLRTEARLRGRHPIVFLNACESGRRGPSLTAWGGWPDAFLKAGAGVFVGTSWPVREVPAQKFSEAFYDSLLQGETIAEAASAGRAATKALGDGSWLAYKVYGHPLARRAE